MQSQSQNKPPQQRSNIRSLSTRIIISQREKSIGDMDIIEHSAESTNTFTNNIKDLVQKKNLTHTIDTNPQDCEQYCKEIFVYWLKQEEKFKASSSYMQQQPEISEKMRAFLIEWIMELHVKFKLQPETLYLTVHVIDRYLSIEHITKKKLQLLGVASLMVACKYEEIYPPDLKDFLYVVGNSYSKGEVLNQERKILNSLKWKLTQPYPITYFSNFCNVFNFEKRQQHLVEFLLELSLLEYHMIKYTPSILACSAILLTLRLFKLSWPLIFQQMTNYSNYELEECAMDLQNLWKKAQQDQTYFKQIKKKYNSIELSNVSKIQLGASNQDQTTRHIKSNSQNYHDFNQINQKTAEMSLTKNPSD